MKFRLSKTIIFVSILIFRFDFDFATFSISLFETSKSFTNNFWFEYSFISFFLIFVFVQRCIEIVVDVVFWKTCFDKKWRRLFKIHINKLILKFVAFTKLVITFDLSNAYILQQIKINRIRNSFFEKQLIVYLRSIVRKHLIDVN